MSTQDRQQYEAHLAAFIGRRLALGLPVNSIKLMLNREQHHQDYIWIDPPWVLSTGGRVVAGSDTYPDPKTPGYAEEHRQWGALVTPLLDGATLADVAFTVDGGVLFTFGNGVRLEVGAQPIRDEFSDRQWYDNWYAKQEDRLSRGAG